MLSFLFFACWILAIQSLPPFTDDDLRNMNALDEFLRARRNEMKDKNKHIPLDKNKDIITSWKPDEYVINMDDPVDIRWGSLCSKYTDDFTQIYQYFDGIFHALNVSETIYALVMQYFTLHITDPYKSEIEFFANCTQVPLEGVLALNLFETLMVLGCTSVVGIDRNDIIFHGRNLDLWLLDIQSALRSISINVEYRSNGKTLFTASSFFGFSGVHVGVKPGAFSISQNTRYSNEFIENLAALQQGYYPSLWLMRDLLSSDKSYEEALDDLVSTPLIAPVYLTIGGVRYPEGAVVTRNYTESINILTLEDSYLEWFVSVANVDWWNDVEDERRDAIIDNMNAVTQKKLKANIMENILRQIPTINMGTISSTVLSASLGTKTMQRTMMVELTVVDEEEEAVQEPLLVAHAMNEAKDLKNPRDSKWVMAGSGIFFVLCLLFNITMCSTYLHSRTSGKYAKISHEMLTLLDMGSLDVDDDTEEDML